MLWTCSERQFERWASEEMKRWRAFDAPSFTRRRDYMRDASRPRAGDYPWHDPQWEEIPMDTQTIAPGPVAAPGSGSVRASRRDSGTRRTAEKRDAERQEGAVWREERGRRRPRRCGGAVRMRL